MSRCVVLKATWLKRPSPVIANENKIDYLLPYLAQLRRGTKVGKGDEQSSEG
jgi:hypothetical protein